jgi:lysozyme family protein
MRTILVILTLALPLGAKTLQEDRWDRAALLPSKKYEAARIVTRIKMNRHRYEAVDAKTRVPWYVIAALHNMESGGSFARHLHEGSSLRARTRYVPKGRPKTGTPPFAWEYSAIDALTYDRMGGVRWHGLDDTLYACERYNGTGYLKYHPSTPSPYLWAGTTVERPGKYIADGKWSSTARSSQIGCAAVWKIMEKWGLVDFRKLKRRD